jgi:hypothetical protein
MWKYWMFQPEKPLRADYVWGFWRGGLRAREAQKMNQFSHMWLELWPQRNSFWQKLFFLLCSHKTITGWKQWIKILQQQKISETESQAKSIEKVLQFFMLPSCMTRIIVIYFFVQYEYLIGYLWGFMLLTPCEAREWMNAYNNYEFDH